MTRSCGACTLCCKLLPVKELHKPAMTRCEHQSSKGCGIYRQLGFPRGCEMWSCLWLIDEDTAGLRRPDRSGYVLDQLPDLVRVVNNETGDVIEIPVMQVWVDPARPEAWRDPALLRFGERIGAEQRMALLIRFDSEQAITAFPPAINSTGKWQFVRGGVPAETVTGSLFLDRLVADQRQRGAAA